MDCAALSKMAKEAGAKAKVAATRMAEQAKERLEDTEGNKQMMQQFAEKVGRTALKMLEVVPGVTVWDVLMNDWDGRDINQIGRQPPKLSPNKSKSHFPNLKEETGESTI